MDNNVIPNNKKVTFDSPTRLNLCRISHPRRKFSFPVTLQSNLLNVDSIAQSYARRRFSNVGDVTRKLSSTIGWRTQNIPTDEVISQGKALCAHYIRNRLKRSGIFNKKLGLQRLRSMVGTSSGFIVRDVFPSLVCAGTELESICPKLYRNVARQSSLSPGGVLVSDKAAAALLVTIGHDLLKNDITWGKIVSIFAIAGGLAVDCVCQGHPEYMHGVLEGVEEIMEDYVADWVATSGGWVFFLCFSLILEITIYLF